MAFLDRETPSASSSDRELVVSTTELAVGGFAVRLVDADVSERFQVLRDPVGRQETDNIFLRHCERIRLQKKGSVGKKSSKQLNLTNQNAT